MTSKIFLIIAIFLSLTQTKVFSAEKVLYDFENKNEACWEVPEWCWEKSDYVCKTVEISNDFANHGSSSLKLTVDFPGQSWRGAIAECESSINLSPYKKISCDFYLPEGTPAGIRAKLILTASQDSGWKWIETSDTFELTPGRWTTVSASLESNTKDWMLPLGSDSGKGSNDPRVAGAVIMKMTDDVKGSIEKMAIRLETDKVAYKGNVYIDNIKVSD